MKRPHVIPDLPRPADSRQDFEKRQRRSAENMALGKVKLSVWLRDPEYRRLKEMAMEGNTSLQQLVEEGIDLLLKKHGQPSISELRKRAIDD